MKLMVSTIIALCVSAIVTANAADGEEPQTGRSSENPIKHIYSKDLDNKNCESGSITLSFSEAALLVHLLALYERLSDFLIDSKVSREKPIEGMSAVILESFVDQLKGKLLDAREAKDILTGYLKNCGVEVPLD